MARPTSYTKDKGLEICKRLANGDSLELICKTKGMPDSDTVRNWKRLNDEFLVNYTRARTEQGEYYGQKVQDVGNKCIKGEIPPDVARVAIDAFKWTAARMNRALYGDRIQQDVNLSGNVTIDNLEKGRERALKREKPED